MTEINNTILELREQESQLRYKLELAEKKAEKLEIELKELLLKYQTADARITELESTILAQWNNFSDKVPTDKNMVYNVYNGEFQWRDWYNHDRWTRNNIKYWRIVQPPT
jgi:predicted ribosome quality control (RQC) complex YloA/Tae2 family protein